MKRVTAAFLLLLMSIGLLAGCGQIPEPPEQTTETTQTPPTTVPTEPTTPFPEGTPLTVVIPSNSYPGEFFEQILEETTGLDMMFYGYAEFTSAQHCREDADIEVYCDLEDLKYHTGYGRFVNLMEYREQLPNFFAFFDSESWEPYRELYMLSETELYCAPVVMRMDNQYKAWIYREDIFRELELEPPTDWDSFYRCLKALKERYPESYPCYISTTGARYSFQWLQDFAQQFGVDFTPEDFSLAEGDLTPGEGSYYEPLVTDEMRLMLSRLRQLVEEGLMYPDWHSAGGYSGRVLLKKGECFIIHGSVRSMLDLEDIDLGELAVDPEFELSVFQNIPLAESEMPFTTRIPSVEGYYWTVIDDPETRDIALGYLDWLYSEDGIRLLSWGKQGVTFDVDAGENKYYLDTVWEIPRLEWPLASEKLSGHIDQAAVLAGYTEEEQAFLLETIASAETGGLETPFYKKPMDSWGRAFEVYDFYRERYLYRFLSGELDARRDDHWQEMTETLEEAGLADLLERRLTVLTEGEEGAA